MGGLKVQKKQYGNVKYLKITGDDDELRHLSHVIRAPVKPSEGYNPEHIDLPVTKHAPWKRAKDAGLLKEEE